MNVRIFWVRAMECMCAQTRPRFILSSEKVFWGMEFGAMLTPRKKIPVIGKFPQRRIEPATLWTASPNTTNELFQPQRDVLCVSVDEHAVNNNTFSTSSLAWMGWIFYSHPSILNYQQTWCGQPRVHWQKYWCLAAHPVTAEVCTLLEAGNQDSKLAAEAAPSGWKLWASLSFSHWLWRIHFCLNPYVAYIT